MNEIVKEYFKEYETDLLSKLGNVKINDEYQLIISFDNKHNDDLVFLKYYKSYHTNGFNPNVLKSYHHKIITKLLILWGWFYD